jgi:hypothetical protein
LDRVSFAQALGLEPDPWQEDLLRSASERVLLNCCRQSGKSTMSALIALHGALYRPGSLTLILAPAERQAKETFSKVAEMYATLGRRVASDSYRKLGMEIKNRSRIEALPGTEKTIRGFSGVWTSSSWTRLRAWTMVCTSRCAPCSLSQAARSLCSRRELELRSSDSRENHQTGSSPVLI